MTSGKKTPTNGPVSMTNQNAFWFVWTKLLPLRKVLIMNCIKKVGANLIIHIFALLHAIVALWCRTTGVEDELLLTCLTMTMALLICIKKGFNIEFSAASIIIVNIIGYLLGNASATLFAIILDSQQVIHALATALTTEILGWSIIAFTKILQPISNEPKGISTQYIKWIILAMTGVFGIRLGIIGLLSSEWFAPGDMMKATSLLLSDSFGMIMLLGINILYVRGMEKVQKNLTRPWQTFILVSFILLAALTEAGLSCIVFPFEIIIDSWSEFIMIFTPAIIIQTTMCCIVFMVNFALTARQKADREKEKTHVAQYRYQKLKRQVNPHFLFNSLNALDCMVNEEKTEQASRYIHKLASVYRYMIRSEEEDMVPLREELTFVRMYIDLLKVRFPMGFNVDIDVPEENQARFVLPCSIQLLIENATKHNTVSVDNPLIIRVESDGMQVKVSNNIIPKITTAPSTGLGQKYIRQQYMDLSGKSILIERTEEEYSVTLPLL